MSENDNKQSRDLANAGDSKSPSTTTDAKDKSRRKLLKSLAAGSALFAGARELPEKWLRPAVESVILPAHAQTSGYSNHASSDTFIVASRAAGKSRKT